MMVLHAYLSSEESKPSVCVLMNEALYRESAEQDKGVTPQTAPVYRLSCTLLLRGHEHLMRHIPQGGFLMSNLLAYMSATSSPCTGHFPGGVSPQPRRCFANIAQGHEGTSIKC